MPTRGEICENLQAEMDTDETIAQNLVFSDEETFHTSGEVDRHNLCACGTEIHATVQHQRDSPKANICCVVSGRQVYGPCFFA
jgi:hypothetical protein